MRLDAPQPVDELRDALQDRVHRDPGRARAARSVRGPHRSKEDALFDAVAPIAEALVDLRRRSEQLGIFVEQRDLLACRTVLQILRNPLYVGERVHAGGTVEGVHEGIIDADLAQRAWRAIDERRTRQPEPRGPALDWDRDPYMLRGLLRCACCERVMTTSASARVTIDNADEVPRYYRCRGDAERRACTPSVQVSAQKVEAIVLAVLKKADPRTIPDRRSRALLEHFRPSWDTWRPAERNRMVRDLVWSIRWSPRRGLAGFTFDTIAIDNFIEQGGGRFAGLPPRRTPT